MYESPRVQLAAENYVSPHQEFLTNNQWENILVLGEEYLPIQGRTTPAGLRNMVIQVDVYLLFRTFCRNSIEDLSHVNQVKSLQNVLAVN
jgi:hypothetical protein